MRYFDLYRHLFVGLSAIEDLDILLAKVYNKRDSLRLVHKRSQDRDYLCGRKEVCGFDVHKDSAFCCIR